MERTSVTVTLNKGDNGFLGCGSAGGTITGLAAHIGFVGFHNAVNAAQRAVAVRTVHGFADAVRHEPCRLVGDAQRAV